MSDYKGKGGPFTIDTHNEIFYNSYILSIRDSGLIIVQTDNISSLFIDTIDAFYLPNSKIKYLTHRGLDGLDAGGAIGGYFLGGIAILGLGELASNATGSDLPKAISIFVGPFIGIFGGGLLFAPQSRFDITKFNDRELLFLLCKYCGREPEAIRKIK